MQITIVFGFDYGEPGSLPVQQKFYILHETHFTQSGGRLNYSLRFLGKTPIEDVVAIFQDKFQAAKNRHGGI